MLAQNDPTSKFKLKYISIAEPEEPPEELIEDFGNSASKRIPMTIQLI